MSLLLDRFLRMVGAGLIAWPFVVCLMARSLVGRWERKAGV